MDGLNKTVSFYSTFYVFSAAAILSLLSFIEAVWWASNVVASFFYIAPNRLIQALWRRRGFYIYDHYSLLPGGVIPPTTIYEFWY